ncbi:MAG: hypothetical protein HGB12_01205 [Bacteroidetes bacterium]|nr:hypothetical protein [Bacteroidota bacterium]
MEIINNQIKTKTTKKIIFFAIGGLLVGLSGILNQAIAGDPPTTLYIGYPSAQSGKYEYYIINNNGDAGVYGTEWRSQSFTPAVSHQITSVKIKAYKTGSPGTLTVLLKNTDGNGKPTGSDLTTGTIDANSFTTASAGDWYEISLATYNLSANTKYAIVLKAVAGDGSNYVYWKLALTGAYTGGTYLNSSNSGTTWSDNTNMDAMFEEWGVPLGFINPTNFTYSAPFFSAINNNGEAVTMYRIQLTLSSDASFASPIWDSGSGGVSMTSTANATRCPDIFYSSSTLLQPGTNYIWRIQFYGSTWTWGPWSTESATIGMYTGALTARFYSGAGDGSVHYRTADTWDVAHDATTGNDGASYTGTTAQTQVGHAGNGDHTIGRAFVPINTAGLPDAASISAATLSVYFEFTHDHYSYDRLNDENCWVGLVQTNQPNATLLTLDDYNNCGATDNPSEGSDTRLDITPMLDTPGYMSYPLNATGLTWIKKTAGDPYTMFGLRGGHDILDISYPLADSYEIGGFRTSEYANTTSDPYLEVTYTIACTAPTLTTQAVSNIAIATATGNGTVTSDGNATITERGVCWNTLTTPTTANSKAISTGTTGTFTSSMTGLVMSTLYYVRAYAINFVGTSYGNEVTFTSTTPTPAIVDWNNSNVQEIILSADRSLTFVNGKSGGVYSLIIKQDDTGGWTIIWPSFMRWPVGATSTFITAASTIYLVKFVYDGTNYLAYAIEQY